VHLTPKAWAFFPFTISEQNFAFAKSSLAFGAGDQHVGQHTEEQNDQGIPQPQQQRQGLC